MRMRKARPAGNRNVRKAQIVGGILPEPALIARIHADSPVSNASGKAAWARLTSIFSNAS
jgi:hypothetical protein